MVEGRQQLAKGPLTPAHPQDTADANDVQRYPLSPRYVAHSCLQYPHSLEIFLLCWLCVRTCRPVVFLQLCRSLPLCPVAAGTDTERAATAVVLSVGRRVSTGGTFHPVHVVAAYGVIDFCPRLVPIHLALESTLFKP